MLFTINNDNNILNDYFNLNNEYNYNKNILKPNEGLILGNLYVDEYIPYKNYHLL